MLRPVLQAFAFMTVLPVPGGRRWEDRAAPWMVAAFPLVGFVLGGLLVVLHPWLTQWPGQLGGVAMAATVLGLTGLLHFDGLTDCADAALAERSPEERRRIARDPHVGSFALAVGGLYLLALVAALAALDDPAALWLVPILARTGAALAFGLFPLAGDSAMAVALRPKPVAVWMAVMLAATLVAGLNVAGVGPDWGAALRAAVAAIAVLGLAGGWLVRKLGGLTGDICGALICLTELTLWAAWPWLGI